MPLKLVRCLTEILPHSSPALYVLLAAAIGLATLQLWSLNVGLARFNAVFFLPIYQALLVLAGVLAGGIYFNEFSKFGILDWFGFFTGVTHVVALTHSVHRGLAHNSWVGSACEWEGCRAQVLCSAYKLRRARRMGESSWNPANLSICATPQVRV